MPNEPVADLPPTTPTVPKEVAEIPTPTNDGEFLFFSQQMKEAFLIVSKERDDLKNEIHLLKEHQMFPEEDVKQLLWNARDVHKSTKRWVEDVEMIIEQVHSSDIREILDRRQSRFFSRDHDNTLKLLYELKRDIKPYYKYNLKGSKTSEGRNKYPLCNVKWRRYLQKFSWKTNNMVCSCDKDDDVQDISEEEYFEMERNMRVIE